MNSIHRVRPTGKYQADVSSAFANGRSKTDSATDAIKLVRIRLVVLSDVGGVYEIVVLT
ncbi:MAG: hypothetical protein AAF802_05670 [Planctomycetota bacterium]